MSEKEGEAVRRELMHAIARLSQKYPMLRLCQLICNAIPPEELARRSKDLYYIEDSKLLDWLLRYEQAVGSGRDSIHPYPDVDPIKRVGPDPVENPVEWCAICKEQVVRYPAEEGCPFCGGATMETGDYIDALYERYRGRW